MRIFVAGGTHGNLDFWRSHLLPAASKYNADLIMQVGDFGLWEHEPEGVDFLDGLSQAAEEHALQVYALHGNHDNWSHAMDRYGNDLTGNGFVRLRNQIFYIPQGHVWYWGGKRMRAFGGAYSINKADLLKEEARLNRAEAHRVAGTKRDGLPLALPRDHTGTLWFADEEMTDVQMNELLDADNRPMDVIFSHDMPFGANPGIQLDRIAPAEPNKRRLQRAMNVHQPALWIHGHLHHPYVDNVRCGDDGRHTKVVGLSCDNRYAPRGWHPDDAWGTLDILPNGTMVWLSGGSLEEAYREATEAMMSHDAWLRFAKAAAAAKQGTEHEGHVGFKLLRNTGILCSCDEPIPDFVRTYFEVNRAELHG